MKKSILMMLILTLVVGASSNVKAQKADKLQAKIEKINALMAQATLDKDMSSFAEYYTDDYIGMPDMAPMIIGKEAALAADKEFEATDVEFTSFNLNTMEVVKTGKKYVYEIGTYDMVMEIPGLPEPWADKGKYLTIWEIGKKDDLKMKVMIYNSDINPWELMQNMGEY